MFTAVEQRVRRMRALQCHVWPPGDRTALQGRLLAAISIMRLSLKKKRGGRKVWMVDSRAVGLDPPAPNSTKSSKTPNTPTPPQPTQTTPKSQTTDQLNAPQPPYLNPPNAPPPPCPNGEAVISRIGAQFTARLRGWCFCVGGGWWGGRGEVEAKSSTVSRRFSQRSQFQKCQWESRRQTPGKLMILH